MPREDQAEGEVVRVGTGLGCIMDGEQHGEPGPPIGGRRGRIVRSEAKPARGPFVSGSGCEPSVGALVVGDHEVIGNARWDYSQAQAEPCRAFGGDQVKFALDVSMRERFKSGRKWDRLDVARFDHHDVGSCVR